MIIIDFGSGNTSQNSCKIIDKMIDTLAEYDKKRQSIIKWQLFRAAGRNVPLLYNKFDYAYSYAAKLGFKTTASVFDAESLGFLLRYPIPFVKIANGYHTHEFLKGVPEKIKVIISGLDMSCISEYPATIEQYESKFKEKDLKAGISDHTTDWTLYKKYKPKIYEFHFCLDDSTGPDAGPFARRPKQLKEFFNE